MPVAIVLSAATLAHGTFTADTGPDGVIHVQCAAAGFTLRLDHDDANQLIAALTAALTQEPQP
jgi:hypothetical protein